MSIEAKLEHHKSVRANGVSYVIRKLTPALFLDKEYMLPISHIVEIKDPKKKNAEIEKTMIDLKDRVREIILRGLVFARHWFKKWQPAQIIDKIMEQPDLYTFIFTAIVNHTLSVKKNPSSLSR